MIIEGLVIGLIIGSILYGPVKAGEKVYRVVANAFGELTDAAEQRARFEADMALKQEIYGERYPIDEDFLEALGHMPDASGVALGFDRLVMLAAGARSIQDVQWTPVET